MFGGDGGILRIESEEGGGGVGGVCAEDRNVVEGKLLLAITAKVFHTYTYFPCGEFKNNDTVCTNAGL